MNAKQIAKTLRSVSHRHSMHDLFGDFVAMSACALSNAFDIENRDAREAEYMRIVKKYEKDEVAAFPKAMSEVTQAFEMAPGEINFDDILGGVFNELELHNKWAGQFFTPYHLAQALAQMNTAGAHEKIAESGFVTVLDPAVGGGALLIAVAEALHNADIDYQKHMHATAVDVDIRCVHMTYVQLTLLHVPAVVVHGNSLSGETYSVWRTPAHIIDLWHYRLNRRQSPEPVREKAEKAEV